MGGFNTLALLGLVATATCFTVDNCDLLLESSICLNGGSKIILPDAVMDGLVGKWSFDDIHSIDGSRAANHADKTVGVGAGFGGRGSSAHIVDGSFVSVPHHDSFGSSPTLSFSLWVYIMESSQNRDSWCPLLHKGSKDSASPSLSLHSGDNSLKVASASSSEKGGSDYMESKARLPSRRWSHVAVTRNNKSIKLYVNGILDSQVGLDNAPGTNGDALYLGGAPWVQDSCRGEMLLDEVRYYDRELSKDEIQAEASPALGGIEPSFISLGCIDCTFGEASSSCESPYRICDPMELHTGGYIVARINGYAGHDTTIFTSDFKGESEEKGLGICCHGL